MTVVRLNSSVINQRHDARGSPWVNDSSRAPAPLMDPSAPGRYTGPPSRRERLGQRSWHTGIWIIHWPVDSDPIHQRF
jgi:hypothetical protein